MRKLISVTMLGALAVALSVGITGCTDESSAEKQTTIKGPEGTTKITEKATVEKSGSNPPAANP